MSPQCRYYKFSLSLSLSLYIYIYIYIYVYIYELVHTKGHNWVVSTLTNCHAYGIWDNIIFFQVRYSRLPREIVEITSGQNVEK